MITETFKEKENEEDPATKSTLFILDNQLKAAQNLEQMKHDVQKLDPESTYAKVLKRKLQQAEEELIASLE
jgi:hypothetical protein